MRYIYIEREISYSALCWLSVIGTGSALGLLIYIESLCVVFYFLTLPLVVKISNASLCCMDSLATLYN